VAKATIMVVEDDQDIRELISYNLGKEGYTVVPAESGEQALKLIETTNPDIIVLDIMLPGMDGIEVLRNLKQGSRHAAVPVIMATAKSEDSDIITGLELGADDYIAKPFSPRQLIARAQAVLRRAGKIAAPAIRQIGPLRLDPDRRELQLSQGEPILLTPLENRLLDYLMLNAGHVLTAESIIQHVWGAEGGDRDMLRQLVHRLRSKINQATSIEGAAVGETGLPRIETIPGLGYGLVAESAPTTD